MLKLFLIVGIVIIVVASLVSFQLQSEPEILADIDLCKGEPVCYSAQVTRVIDGDTLDVMHLSTGEPLRIRLALVDTPELGEALFSEASKFTASMCPVDSRIVFDADDGQPEGSHNRVIGAVYCSGVLLNEELLEARLADLDFRFCESSEYADEWAQKYGC